MNYNSNIRSVFFIAVLLLSILITNASNATMLAGKLTVGGPNANYNSITAALNDLKLNGMSADVEIDVNQSFGPYIEQLNIESIPGLGASAKLTIKGNNSIVKNSISGSVNVYIIKLAASYVTIDGFVFEVFDGSSSDKNVAIVCTQNSNYNKIINNKFKLKKTFTVNNQIGILFSGILNFTTPSQGDYKYNIIENNIFEGSKYSIYIAGRVASIEDRGNEIKNNKFSDFTSTAIYTSFVDSLVVNNNDVFQSTSFKNTTHTGILRFMHIANGAESFKIRNNRIYDILNNTQSAGGLHIFYFLNCGSLPTGKEAVIENNIVYNSVSYTGSFFFYVSGSLNGLRVYHNSVKLNSNSICYAFYLSTVSNFNNNHFYNNLINFYNSNSIIFGIGSSSSYSGIKSDNNAYYTALGTSSFATNISYSLWRSTFKADSNSLIFTFSQNLIQPHEIVPDQFSTVAAAGRDVSTTHDYWNNLRSNLTPSIGAFEKPYSDLQGPNLSMFTVLPTLSVNSRKLIDIATGSDISGIDTSFGVRLYFNKRSSVNKFLSNTNADDGWKYVKPINQVGIYNTFIINYQLFKDSILKANDTIDYFLVSRDIYGNYGVNNNKITDQFLLNKGLDEILRNIIPDFYVISEIIPDTLYVGSSHKFKSLTNEDGLFRYLKYNYASKPIQVLIDSDLEESGKYGLDEIYKVNGKSNKLYIDAHANRAVNIIGSYKGGLIRFEGVDSVYWSQKSDSIKVINNHLTLVNDTTAVFTVGSRLKNHQNTSNAIHIYNTSIQTNPNSNYTSGLFVGRLKSVQTDQSYEGLVVAGNKFLNSKNGLVFSYANSFFSIQYLNYNISDNHFEFDSLVNVVNASNTASLIFKGNVVKANHLSSSLVVSNFTIQAASQAIFYLIYPYGNTKISSNKIFIKNSKDQGINVFDISKGFNVNIDNNIIDLDVTNFNLNRSSFYKLFDLDDINYAFNASFIRNNNFDNITDDVCFLSVGNIYQLNIRNNQFVNYAKHQSFKTVLMDFISARPNNLALRKNYVSKVFITESISTNTFIPISDFENNTDTLMDFIYDDANINTTTYKSQNNALISKGIYVIDLPLDIDGKNRRINTSVGPYELDSINVDVELLKILIADCVDTTNVNYKVGFVLRNNAKDIDSAKLSIAISDSDTSTNFYQYVFGKINHNVIDTLYIPLQTLRQYVKSKSMFARLQVINDQVISNNSVNVGFTYGETIVSSLLNQVTDTICLNSKLEVSLKDELDRIYKWYDATEYGNLIFEGKKYVFDNNTPSNLYVELLDKDIVKKKAMPQVGGTTTRGTYFTIKNKAIDPINIRYLSLQVGLSGTTNSTKLFVKKGTFVGYENNANAWVELNVRNIKKELNYLTLELLDSGTVILNGDSLSFYFHVAGTANLGTFMNEQISNGIYSYNAQDFDVYYGTGAGGNVPFAGNLVTNRRPCVKVYYNNPNKCLKSNRVKVNVVKQKSIIAKISPNSVAIQNNEGTISNPDVLCYYSDNKYSIVISNDFNNYMYNRDWVVNYKLIRNLRGFTVDYIYDTATQIVINKNVLNQDSIYTLTYSYTDKISGCTVSTLRYFKFGREITRSLPVSGVIKKCSFDSLEIKAFHDVPYFKYIWSTGETTSKIKVLNPGKYFLTTYTPFCFQKTDSIIIESLPEQDSLVMNIIQIDSCQYRFSTEVSSNYTVEWDFGDGKKAVGYEVIHEYTANDNYRVSLRRLTSVAYCLRKNISEQMINVMCLPVSVSNNKEDRINIYPNPSNDYIYIDTKEKIESIVLIDINGRIISNQMGQRIDISDLSDGVYIVEIRIGDSLYRKKVMKN